MSKKKEDSEAQTAAPAPEKVIPNVPCVEFEGKTRQISYGESGRVEKIAPETMFYEVTSEGDLAHVMQMRREKRFKVVAHHNLHLIPKKDTRDAIKQGIEEILNPPELD